MAKKQVPVSLRKPPPVDEDSFVARSRHGAHSYIRELKAQVDDLHAITVRLPRELASRLLQRCLHDDCDVSTVVAELVRAHLDRIAPCEQDREITLAMIVRWATKKLAALAPWRAFTTSGGDRAALRTV
jgi:hypothetical protein